MLTNKQIDVLLEDFDKTPSGIQRRTIARLVEQVAAAEATTMLLQEIVDDASPCTSGCSRLVDESLIERAEQLLTAGSIGKES